MKPLILALALGAGAQPFEDPAALDFNAVYRAAVEKHLAAQPLNAAAREASAFLAASPGLRFEQSAQDASEAIYDSEKKAVVISASALMASGVDARRSRLDPELASDSVKRIAPLIVHELKHAETDAALGFGPPSLEDELLAYAAEARYVGQDRDWADRENFERGMRRLREYSPLWRRRTALQAEQYRLALLYRAAEADKDVQESKKLGAEIMKVEDDILAAEAKLAEKSAELKERGAPEWKVAPLKIWAAHASGWRAFKEEVAGLENKPSVFESESAINERLENWRRQAARGELSSAERARSARVSAFWSDRAALERARRYFTERLAQEQASSGGGYRPAPEPPAAAAAPSRRGPLIGAALGFAAGAALGLRWAGRRRRRKRRAKIKAFVDQHHEEFGVETLRESLLGEGWEAEDVDAAIAELRARG